MIIFLDIDGVVATATTYAALRGAWREDMSLSGKLIDPALVANVQRLCDAVQAEGVVICSSWRRLHEWDQLVGWLKEAGLTAPLLGKTGVWPITRKPRMDDWAPINKRGIEIQAWMDEHGKKDHEVIILEDDRDVSPNAHRQIQPSFDGDADGDQGFTEKYLNQALALARSPGYEVNLTA